MIRSRIRRGTRATVATLAATAAVAGFGQIPAHATASAVHGSDSFHVVFNQHVTNGDGSTTIIGAHMYLDGPTAVGELVVAAATCGVSA